MKHYTASTVITLLGAVILALFGPWHITLQVLIVLIVCDLVSGLIRAAIQKRWSSSVSFRGALKKVLILLVVVVGYQIDQILKSGCQVRNLTILFFCVSEGLSVLENAAAAGLPVPPFLKKLLQGLNEKKLP